jgi:hypothetical protein
VEVRRIDCVTLTVCPPLKLWSADHTWLEGSVWAGPPELRLRTETDEGETDTFATTDAPPNVAVTTAFWVVVPPALTVNCAERDPAGTVTDEGTVSDTELLVREIGVLVAATVESVMVQVAELPDCRLSGAQDRLFSEAVEVVLAPESAPPVPLMVMSDPVADAPVVLLSPKVTPPTFAGKVTLTTATTPDASGVALEPERTQEYAPEAVAQDSDFPAALAAGPGLALIEATLLAG